MLCVVIPTLNADESLSRLLSDLADDTMSITTRIVITDGGSDDQTVPITVAHDGLLTLGASGRGGQLALGARWAFEAEWILFLHADCRLAENWGVRVREHMAEHSERAGYFDLRFDSSKWQARIVERLVRWRCALWALPYGDQGLLISRHLYEASGGFSDIVLFEDVKLIQTLGRRRLRRLGTHIMTTADKYERDGFFKRGWRNLALLRRYLKGAHPDDLIKDYK